MAKPRVRIYDAMYGSAYRFKVIADGLPEGYSYIELRNDNLVLMRKRDHEDGLVRWAWRRDKRSLSILPEGEEAITGWYRPGSRLLWLIERALLWLTQGKDPLHTYHKEVIRLRRCEPPTERTR